MNFIKENSGVVALVILAILGLLSLGGVGQKALFGSTACDQITCLSGGLRLVSAGGGDFESDIAAVFNSTVKFSTTGTAINRIDTGTCYLVPVAATITATTSVDIDCQATAAVDATVTRVTSALPGVTSGDYTQVQLSTTTSKVSPYGSLVVTGSSASTTAGYITLRLMNLTGTTYTYPIGLLASGTASYIVTK